VALGWYFNLRIELSVVQSWAPAFDPWQGKNHQKSPKSQSKKLKYWLSKQAFFCAGKNAKPSQVTLSPQNTPPPPPPQLIK